MKRRGGVNSPFLLHHRCVGRVGPMDEGATRRAETQRHQMRSIERCDEAGEDPAAPDATIGTLDEAKAHRNSRRGQSPRQPEALPRRISVGGDKARGR